ncbi:MAG: protein kinase [Actinomycetota bacterium]|nr:protein kinase [Actinomycetota bacterium]
MSSQLDVIAGRYVLETEISRGGMATVWQARDQILARPVAVKVLHPHLSEDEAFLERFRREALAAARLSHPNIVSIFDTGTQESESGAAGVQFIVMELCAGGTLAGLLAGGSPMEPERVVAIGITICDALGYAHRQGVIHRDVKPANVLIAADGLLKVGDFGIARAAFVKGDITTTGSIIGTVTYLSPEQGQGREPDHRSDLYALGVVLYELLVGRPPFTGQTEIGTALMHLKHPPPPPRSIKAGVPRPLEATILKALEKDPAQRFADADEMAAALGASLERDGATVAMRMPVPRRRGAAPERTRAGDAGWILRVVGAVLGAILLAVFVSSLLDGAGEGPEPQGEQPSQQRPQPAAAAPLEIASATDFDPHGDGAEHSDEAPAAADGDTSTSWTTESYSSSLAAQGKPGVGLVFDLGATVDVTEVRIQASSGLDLEVRASDSLGSDEQAFVEAAGRRAIPPVLTLRPDPTSGRYWLIWITEIGPEGGAASIAEVEFRGS